MAQSSWKDVSVVILGRTIEGITNVEYDSETTLEYTRGRGADPLAIVKGNTKYEGSITLLQSEHQAMVAAVNAGRPGASLQDVSFDIIVDYENDNGTVSTDTIVGARFKSYKKKMANGDTHMKIELPFMYLRLVEGVV